MTTHGLPDDIRQQLVDAGHLTTDGLGRKSRLVTCPGCGSWVVTGLDARTAAIRVSCDPVALDAVGELTALLEGRATYEMWGREIERRNQFNIAGGIKRPVVAAHRCGIRRPVDPVILALFIKAKPITKEMVPF